MSTPYPIGSRVVCPNPAGRLFVGVVHHVHNCGDLTVTDGVAHVRASVEEVRPVMPRGPEDLERWGRWWWCEDFVVAVMAMLSPPGIAMFWPASDRANEVYAHDGWAGPVQPPPEVRS